jgi:ribosomal protein S18 acetylase RimI-like enzyme
VTAATLLSRKATRNGIRPVNPRSDMGAIADLIQEAFDQDMDPIGNQLVRDMKAFSRAGFLGWLLGRLFLPQAAYPMGYVWEEDGQVVGNASMLRVDGFPSRWVMANVAVDPAYQRKGIGRALIQASLEFAQKKKAREVILQALSSNQVAQVLYASLGFKPLSTRTTWSRRRSQMMLGNVDTGAARLRAEGEWHDQLALAERLHPEGLVWPYPLTPSIFHVSGFSAFFFQENSQHWVWFEGHRLLGSLTARFSIQRSTVRFILMVEPEAQGEIEANLVNAGLMAFAHRRVRIVMDYPSGIAIQDFQGLGFEVERTLTWMSKHLDGSGQGRSWDGFGS